jgi:hypothetical protein
MLPAPVRVIVQARKRILYALRAPFDINAIEANCPDNALESKEKVDK